MKIRDRTIYLWGLGFFGFILSILPIKKLLICPPWDIRVIDGQGHVQANIPIKQQWQFYGITTESREELLTDNHGRVHFPERSTYGSVLGSVFSQTVGRLAVHSSYGPSVNVRMYEQGFKDLEQWWDKEAGRIGSDSPNVVNTRIDPPETTFSLVPEDLWDAINHSDLPLARRLLTETPRLVELYNTAGDTPLSQCPGTPEAFRLTELLLKFGANVNAVNLEGKTPLHLAAERADPELVNLLLKNGADANARTKDQATPLHIVIGINSDLHGDRHPKRQIQIMAALVAHGASVNAPTVNGTTPLHAAARVANPEIIKSLRALGADVKLLNSKQQTPFDVARQYHKNANAQAVE